MNKERPSRAGIHVYFCKSLQSKHLRARLLNKNASYCGRLLRFIGKSFRNCTWSDFLKKRTEKYFFAKGTGAWWRSIEKQMETEVDAYSDEVFMMTQPFRVYFYFFHWEITRSNAGKKKWKSLNDWIMRLGAFYWCKFTHSSGINASWKFHSKKKKFDYISDLADKYVVLMWTYETREYHLPGSIKSCVIRKLLAQRTYWFDKWNSRILERTGSSLNPKSSTNQTGGTTENIGKKNQF